MEIKLTIPDEKLKRITDAFKGFYPISEIDGVSTHTDNAWAKKKIKDFIVDTVYRWETNEARKALIINKDDTLLN